MTLIKMFLWMIKATFLDGEVTGEVNKILLLPLKLLPPAKKSGPSLFLPFPSLLASPLLDLGGPANGARCISASSLD